METQRREGQRDPLAELRAGDHRSTTERVQDRLTTMSGRRVSKDQPHGHGAPRALPWVIVFAALIAAYGIPRLTAASAPPIEDSIPLASGSDVLSARLTTSTSVGRATAGTQAGNTLVSDSASGEPITMHVAGAVLRPGLVHGDSSWRLADAIEAAGGAGDRADLDRVNLAAFVGDASRVYIPTKGEAELPKVVAGDPRGDAGIDGETAAEATGLINLNTADSSGLQTLPGIGPATAQAIISHREEHGLFGAVEALIAVRGIGEAKLEALRPNATV